MTLVLRRKTMRSLASLARAISLSSLLAACSSTPAEQVPAPTHTARFRVPASGLPDPLEVPFPSDLYRTGPGGTGPVTDALGNWSNLGVTQGMETLRYAYAGLDGFGHTSGALFLIDGATETNGIDTTSLPSTGEACLGADSAVAIVDVDDATGGDPQRLPCVASYVPEVNLLVVHPEGVPLRTGRRYAVVLTDRVRTTAGTALGAAPEFAAIRDKQGDARKTPAGTLFGVAIDRAAAALGSGFAPAHITGMAVYSASSEHRRLRPIRDALVKGDYGAAPTLLTDPAAAAPFSVFRFGATASAGYTATLDEWLGAPRKDKDGKDLPGSPGDPGGPEPASTGWPHDAIGAVIQGAFSAPEFRTAWTETPKPGNGAFSFDPNGKAIGQPDAVRIPVTIVLPKTPPPASGYPVLIASHGTPTHRQFVMHFANEVARAGIATVAMDGLYHGVRGRDGKDVASNYPGTYVGPDGFNDASEANSSVIDLAGNFVSAERYRANLWQYQIEWSQLRRLIANPSLDLSFASAQYPGGTTLRFDASHIGWVGTSWGAVTGAAMLTLEPGIGAFFLNVGNGDMLQWQGEAPANRSSVAIASVLFGFPNAVPISRFHPLINVAFGAIEPGFASSSAEDLGAGADAPGPDILMTEVEYDEYICNRSTELLARALNIPQVSPNARKVAMLEQVASPVSGNVNGRTRGLVHMGSASHSSNLARRWDKRDYEFPVALQDDVSAPFPAISPPVWVRQPVAATQAMLVKFLLTSFQGKAVIDASGVPLRIDFDDDGYCDATEQAAGTSWIDPKVHPSGAQDCAWDPGY